MAIISGGAQISGGVRVESWIPSYTVNYLAAAGGGGGSGSNPGVGAAYGGGAGGLLYGSATIIPGVTYTITIGGGGAGSPSSTAGCGTTNGGTGGITGIYNSGANGSSRFNGSNRLTVSNAALAMGTSDFTAEAWVKPYAWTGVWHSIFSTRATASTAGQTAVWALGVNSSGFAYVYSGQFVGATSVVPISLNQWTHVAVVRLSGTISMFVNGVSVGVTTVPGGNGTAVPTANENYTTSSGAVGANVDGSEAFNGWISNLRIVKGTALYTANFTPSTTPLTAVTNTSLLILQSSSAITDASTNAITITNVGSVNTTIYSPFIPLELLSYGGGGGAGYRVGVPGGSGGGSGYPNLGGTLGAGYGYPGVAGVTQQGFPGGLNTICSAGGGGATAAGVPRLVTNAPPAGGAGGAGYTWPYTATTYSRGGNGGLFPTTAGTAATIAGYGNGGNGGNYPTMGAGSSGNGGVVVLTVPTPVYPSTIATGAAVSTPANAPGMTVLTWTSSGTYTA